MSVIYLDTASNFHPFECNGQGRCIHCDRQTTDSHHPDICALCDPEYDMQPNAAWDQRVENDARRESGKARRGN